MLPGHPLLAIRGSRLAQRWLRLARLLATATGGSAVGGGNTSGPAIRGTRSAPSQGSPRAGASVVGATGLRDGVADTPPHVSVVVHSPGLAPPAAAARRDPLVHFHASPPPVPAALASAEVAPLAIHPSWTRLTPATSASTASATSAPAAPAVRVPVAAPALAVAAPQPVVPSGLFALGAAAGVAGRTPPAGIASAQTVAQLPTDAPVLLFGDCAAERADALAAPAQPSASAQAPLRVLDLASDVPAAVAAWRLAQLAQRPDVTVATLRLTGGGGSDVDHDDVDPLCAQPAVAQLVASALRCDVLLVADAADAALVARWTGLPRSRILVVPALVRPAEYHIGTTSHAPPATDRKHFYVCVDPADPADLVAVWHLRTMLWPAIRQRLMRHTGATASAQVRLKAEAGGAQCRVYAVPRDESVHLQARPEDASGMGNPALATLAPWLRPRDSHDVPAGLVGAAAYDAGWQWLRSLEDLPLGFVVSTRHLLRRGSPHVRAELHKHRVALLPWTLPVRVPETPTPAALTSGTQSTDPKSTVSASVPSLPPLALPWPWAAVMTPPTSWAASPRRQRLDCAGTRTPYVAYAWAVPAADSRADPAAAAAVAVATDADAAKAAAEAAAVVVSCSGGTGGLGGTAAAAAAAAPAWGAAVHARLLATVEASLPTVPAPSGWAFCRTAAARFVAEAVQAYHLANVNEWQVRLQRASGCVGWFLECSTRRWCVQKVTQLHRGKHDLLAPYSIETVDLALRAALTSALRRRLHGAAHAQHWQQAVVLPAPASPGRDTASPPPAPPPLLPLPPLRYTEAALAHETRVAQRYQQAGMHTKL